jgi:DivIVA domain-containing protein
MTWFFAVIIVAVMGGVAVVASGRGGGLAETFDDRPDARVPADGPLSGDDVRRVRFSTAFRGYRMSEVDALLDRVAAELEAGSRPDTSVGKPSGQRPKKGPG